MKKRRGATGLWFRIPHERAKPVQLSWWQPLDEVGIGDPRSSDKYIMHGLFFGVGDEFTA